MELFTNHGANLSQVSRLFGLNTEDIIDFSSNINIFIPDINYEKIISEIKKSINKYPDINYFKLKSDISKIYGVDSKYIYPANGATQCIYDILAIEKIRKIGIFHPSFSEYERVCKLREKKVVDLDINSIKNIYEDMSLSDFKSLVCLNKEDEVKTLDILILCNPNNPSGKIEDIFKLLNFCKKNDMFLLVDETFTDFLDNDRFSLKNKVKDYDNLIVISAITKFFAMTGARLGYSFCSNFYINERLNYAKQPWSINILAEQIAKELICIDKQFYKKTKNYYEKETSRLYKKYSSINEIKTSKSSTCFICLEFDKSIDVKDIYVYLLKKHNMLVRVLNNYKNINNNSIRLAIKDRKSNDEIFSIIVKEILNPN